MIRLRKQKTFTIHRHINGTISKMVPVVKIGKSGGRMKALEGVKQQISLNEILIK